jgi:hypothetical protein
MARPHSKTPAPSPPGGRVFYFAGWARCLPRFLLGPPSADYAINIVRFGLGGSLRASRSSGESRRRRELQGRVSGNNDWRLCGAGGIAELSGGEVLGAAGVADVDQAVYDLDVEARGQSSYGGGGGRDLRESQWSVG